MKTPDADFSADCPLAIRLFGHPEVLVAGTPMARLHSRRGLWLLAILALRDGKSIERAQLAGLLWPDSDDPTALHNLRQTLADLRRALGPAAALIAGESPRTIRLDTARAAVDVLRFDLLCAAADRETLACAAGLYCGPLLEGCDEPWVAQERALREASYLAALESLAADCARSDDHAGAARWLRRAIAADPYRESACRALMEALSEVGQFGAVMEVYRDLRLRLHRDLNVEPDAATVARFRALRDRQAPRERAAGKALAPLWRPRVPVPRTRLIGREDALREVVGMLRANRLVTLAGTGGIGKTRLAVQVATELENEYPQSVAFVHLAPHADAETVPALVRETLCVPPPGRTDDDTDALARYLASQSVLLVLDNCEHLLEACATLADALLGRCGNLRILTSSRHALGMTGEAIYRVPSLDDAATELFAERARSVEPSFTVSPATLPLIVDICRRLDGIPLAIELAAARVRALSLREISERLTKGLELLAVGGPAIVPRHQTLEAAFDWSWQLLSEDERSVLQRLAVFAGGCTLVAAERVCGEGEVCRDQVLDLLTSLVDKSLVVYASDRYQLLETVRQFAAARLRESGEEEAARDRHRNHFLEWAEELRPHLWTPEQGIWFERLEQDHDNLRAALGWTRSKPADALEEYRLVSALSRFWDTHGHLREGRTNLEAALTRGAGEVPTTLVGDVSVQAGWAATQQGDIAAARAHYSRGLEIWVELGEDRKRANTLSYLALALKADGELIAARSLLEESLVIRRRLGSEPLTSVLANLGQVEMDLGNDEIARRYFEETVQFCQRVGRFHQQVAITYRNLAELDLRQHLVHEAEQHCASSLLSLRKCDAIVELPDTLLVLGLVAEARGDWVRRVRLMGAEDTLRVQVGLQEQTSASYAFSQAALRTLGQRRYDELYMEGMQMDAREAIEYGLSSLTDSCSRIACGEAP